MEITPAVPNLQSLADRENIMADTDANTEQSTSVTTTHEEDQTFHLCFTKSMELSPRKKRSIAYYLISLTWSAAGVHLPPPKPCV